MQRLEQGEDERWSWQSGYTFVRARDDGSVVLKIRGLLRTAFHDLVRREPGTYDEPVTWNGEPSQWVAVVKHCKVAAVFDAGQASEAALLVVDGSLRLQSGRGRRPFVGQVWSWETTYRVFGEGEVKGSVWPTELEALEHAWWSFRQYGVNRRVEKLTEDGWVPCYGPIEQRQGEA